MPKLFCSFEAFLRDEDGATAVEYAVLIAFIAAVIVAGATLLGLSTEQKFSDAASAVGGVDSQ